MKSGELHNRRYVDLIYFKQGQSDLVLARGGDLL